MPLDGFPSRCPILARTATLAFFVYAAGLFAYYAFAPPGLFERDGYFHARFAAMLPARGISWSFPWTDLSTWKDGFCDKEFLYHVLMAPFAALGDEPLRGAQVLMLLLAVGVLAAMFAVLRAHGAPWPLFWVLVALAAGGLFLARLTMVRSHVLSMLLQVVAVHFLVGRRPRLLAVLGVVYAWSYTVPFALVMTVGVYEVGCFAGRRELDLRPLGAAAAGVVLGLTVHPYTPLTLETFLTYVDVLRFGLAGTTASGLELGHEIYPYAPAVFFNIYPLLSVQAPTILVAAFLFRRRLAAETLGLVAAGLFWFGLTLAAPRFVEYSVPMLALAAGFVARDVARAPRGRGIACLRRPHIRVLLGAACWLSVAALHARSLRFYDAYQFKNAGFEFRGAARWMEGHLAAGELVLNLDWDDFPALFYDAPRQRYLWGLDPTYSYRYAPETTVELQPFAQRRAPFDAAKLRELTGARYLAMRTYRARRYPGFRGAARVAYRDPLATIFDLAP